MKKRQVILFISALLSITGVLKAQTNYEFTYDAAGNRTRRAVVILTKGDSPGEAGGRSGTLVSQAAETDDGVR